MHCGGYYRLWNHKSRRETAIARSRATQQRSMIFNKLCKSRVAKSLVDVVLSHVGLRGATWPENDECWSDECGKGYYRVYRSNLSFLMFSHGHVTAKNRRKMHFFTKPTNTTTLYIFFWRSTYLLGTGPSTPTSLRIHRVHYNMTVLYHVGSPTFN